MLHSSKGVKLKKLSAQDVHLLQEQPELFFQKNSIIRTDGDWPYDGLKAYLPLFHELLLENPNAFTGPWVMVTEQNQLIGDISVKTFNENVTCLEGSDSLFEMAYFVTPAKRNKGYATEAIARLSTWFFEMSKQRVLYARTKKGNLPSQRVLQKTGFKRVEEDDFVRTYIKKRD